MCCPLLLLLVFGPRVVLALLFFLTSYISHAYHGLLLPLLGFIFLPWTTLAYAWIVNNGHSVNGIYLIVLVVTVIVDLGAHGGGYRHSRR
ncbi:MAG TPA: hypothetical protein VHD76_20360 [Bryobacteraceae bacterium]|mgnify:FL=1|jgi:hypothetical protein|nr:hypothetical protein [Bryobacteraceae bacterium]